MNIFWIVTDSICNYERTDLHGLLPIYKKLKNNYEGFYFENALAQFPSTVLSIFSFLTGRFPYFIFPDFDKLTKTLPSLKDRNFITSLKNNGYNIFCPEVGIHPDSKHQNLIYYSNTSLNHK